MNSIIQLCKGDITKVERVLSSQYSVALVWLQRNVAILNYQKRLRRVYASKNKPTN